MDGADHGQPGPREPAQELDDPERALGIQSRRRLVAEEDRRAADDFDGDREALALLGVEAGRGRADDGVLEVRQVEQVEDVVDVGELVGVGDRGVLAQER